MPRVKGENYSKEARRNIIMKAGLSTFCKMGYDATNIEDIAREAKCSHGLIYYYFKNKQEIFNELLVEAKTYAEKFRTTFNTSGGLSARTQLKKDTELMLEVIEKDDMVFEYFQFLNMISMLKKNCDEYCKVPKYVPYDIVKLIFDRGIAASEFISGDSGLYANTYLALLTGLAARKMQLKNNPKNRFTLPSADFILRMFLK